MTTTEYRLIVRGWKYRPEKTFVDYDTCFSLEQATERLEKETARIGEAVDIWQPHITSVELKTRQVTDWEEVLV